MDSKVISIDEAITILTRAKEIIGGDKNLILCLTDSGIEDANVNALRINNDEFGQYVSVSVCHPSIQE